MKSLGQNPSEAELREMIMEVSYKRKCPLIKETVS
jgi:hypothetical protein